MYEWVDNIPLNRLRVVIQEAWKAITSDILNELVLKMRDCCQAVIDVQGGHTKY